MDQNTVDVTIKAYLKEMRQRLEQAASIAMAADMCADAATSTRPFRSRSTLSNCFMK